MSDDYLEDLARSIAFGMSSEELRSFTLSDEESDRMIALNLIVMDYLEVLVLSLEDCLLMEKESRYSLNGSRRYRIVSSVRRNIIKSVRLRLGV
jgi:hypothetical protein